MFKILSECMGSDNVCSSSTSLEKQFVVIPKPHAEGSSNDQVSIKNQHLMVDSSISQVHLSSHGNSGQTCSSTIKGIGAVSVHDMPYSLGK